MNLKLLLKRAFFAARGRSYDRREWVNLRTAIGTDTPDAIPAVLASGAKLEGTFGFDSQFPDEGPLFYALAHKKFKAGAALVTEKPEWLHEVNNNGQTLLHRLAARNNGEAVEFLAERGLEIEAKDNKGLTPMMLAVRASALDAAVALAGVGAKLDLSDPMIDTALRVATVEMNTDFLKIVGTIKQEEAAREQARVAKEITAMCDGTTREVAVKTLRLLPRKAGNP